MTPIGIHKHYEILDSDDNVIFEAPTIKALVELSGYSDKALRNGVIKRKDWVVVKVEYIIFEEDEIYDVTETERSRLSRTLKQWEKERKLARLKRKAVKSRVHHAIMA